MLSLARMPTAARGRVAGIRGSDAISVRLMEMGLFEGAPLQVIGRAPLGDPLHVRVGDFELSIRASEADLVDVAPV